MRSHVSVVQAASGENVVVNGWAAVAVMVEVVDVIMIERWYSNYV